MTTLDEIVIKIDADIKGALAGIAKVEKSVAGMDSSVSKAAGGIRKATGAMVKSFAVLGTGAAVGLAVAVGKATATFSDFEQAVTNAASVTGQSGAQYEATKDNIENLSKSLGETTVFSAQQAASAMYDLASAGYDVGTMVQSDLKPLMDLAAATQSDLTLATETVTATLGQFGLGIEDSSKITDVFAKTIGSSKATIEKLGLALKQVGPVAHGVGLGIEDVNAMLGQLFNAGFKGEQAGTALKGAFTKLLNPTSDVNSVLDDLNLTYDQVNPATADFADTLELLMNSGIDTNQAMKLFGSEAGPAMLALMANTDGIMELENSLRSAGGAAEEMASKQLDTFKGSITLLKSALEGLLITIGETVAPAIKAFVESFTAAIPTIKTLISEGFNKLLEIAKDLSPTFDNLKSIFSSTLGILKDIFESFEDGNGETADFVGILNTLTGALAKVFKWIDKHPTVTKLAITIGAAAVAFAYILPAVVAVVGAIGTVVGAISGAVGLFAAGGTAVSALGVVIAALGGPITVVVGAIALLAAAWATNLFGIRDKTASAFETIKYWIESTKDVIMEQSELIKTVLMILLGPIGAVILAFKNWDEIKEVVGKVLSAITTRLDEAATNAKEWGKNIISSFVSGIREGFDAIRSAVAEAASIVKDYIGFSSPTKEGAGKYLMEWGPNMVKGFAEGVEKSIGTVNNAFDGLAGPMYRGGTATTAGGLGVTGNQITNTFQINIRDTVIREDADIDKLVNKLEAKLANNTRMVNV